MTAKTAVARVLPSAVLKLVGTSYETENQACAEGIANEIDAGATQIWILLEEGQLSIIGNGHGMIPEMLAADSQRLSAFFADVEGGKVQRDFRLADIIAPDSPSRKSLEWMMGCIALSAKRGQDGKEGMLGIGATAYYQYGDSARVITKPHPRLAQAYWGSSTPLGNVFHLDPPSKADLEAFDASYHIDFHDGDLLDPWGRPLPHGTRIDVKSNDLKPGDSDLYRIGPLVSYLKHRFGGHLGRVKLTVVDRANRNAQRARSGEKLHRISAPTYKGIPVLEETGGASGVDFRMRVLFDPNASTKSPHVVHGGSSKFLLTDLPAFREGFWASGKLTGTIEFPRFPNEHQLWNAPKTRLTRSAQRRNWEAAIMAYEGQIARNIEVIQERIRAKRFDDLAADLGRAATGAMAQLEAYQDNLISRVGVAGTPGRKHKRRHLKLDVSAVVFSEHHTSVRNVEIELIRGAASERKLTGITGKVGFGKMPPGHYVIRISRLPRGVTLGEGPREIEFTIDDQTVRGFGAIFRVVTGEERPEPAPRIQGIKVEFTPLSDPGTPWESMLDSGRIIVNSMHTSLVDAWDAGDWPTIHALVAEYASAAIAMHVIRGETEYIMIQKSLLFEVILKSLMATAQTRRRSRKRKR